MQRGRNLFGQIRQRMASVDELGKAEPFLSEFKSLGVKGTNQYGRSAECIDGCSLPEFPKFFIALFTYFCYADLLGSM